MSFLNYLSKIEKTRKIFRLGIFRYVLINDILISIVNKSILKFKNKRPFLK